MTNTEVVKAYFNAFKNGDMEMVLDSFHNECIIISVKEGKRNIGDLHGTYTHKKEAVDFLNNITALFEPESFEIDDMVESGNLVYTNGRFTHIVKATGKRFYSEWVQRCIIQDDKIKEYRFYEDSAAYLIANQANH